MNLVLNARLDVFIRREGELKTQLAEGTRRARLYREAGCDCIYPIALSDPDALRTIVAASDTVNVTLRRDGPLSLATAITVGARRATYAASLFGGTLAVPDAMVAEIRAEAAHRRVPNTGRSVPFN